MTVKVPVEPTAASDVEETKKYLEFLRSEGRPVEIRQLIGYWGVKSRGKNSLAVISSDLALMGLRTEPPFDSGPLDSLVTIQRLSEEAAASAEQPDDHLLTLSRLPSASFALPRQASDPIPIGYVMRDTTVSEAVTVMLRYDFSQLPVVDSKANREVIGVFTWQSYAEATLRGHKPQSVGDSMAQSLTVDLHSDLFASVGPVADHGFVLVTYRGALSGIVTAADLTREFEDLALPFLAVGRCEQELRRVARDKFPNSLPKGVSAIEELAFGRLQELFRVNWKQLGWQLSQDEFIGWLDATRKMRNSIAHFDNQDKDSSASLEVVHRLTRWLRSIPTDSTLPAGQDLGEELVVATKSLG